MNAANDNTLLQQRILPFSPSQYLLSLILLLISAGSVPAALAQALPPVTTKTFTPSTIALNGTTAATFTVSNPNPETTLTGVSFTDTLPPGLINATPTGITGTCTGASTAVVVASSGGPTVGFSATLSPNTNCTFTVNMVGTTDGTKVNTTGPVASSAGPGAAGTATLVVAASPPTITKAFGASTIPLNGTTTVTFTIANPNTGTTLTGVAFTDALPPGMVIATPSGVTGTCTGASTGVVTLTSGSDTIAFSGTLNASTSCTFSVNVVGTTVGTKFNTTGPVASSAGAGTAATATLAVLAPPSIAKVFNPTSFAPNQTNGTLTFTINNPNALTALTGVAFTDTLPAGLTIGGTSSAMCGGTLTTTPPDTIALSGATIAGSGQCQFSVTLAGGIPGQYTNTTGAVTSTNGGTGNTATASVTILAPSPIPTLQQWALALLGTLLGLIAIAMLRRSRYR